MIRFRIGAVAPLGRHPATEEFRAPVSIEIDGIDISGGLLDDPLVPAGLALVQAVARLVEGTSRTAAVSFDDGAMELILARRLDRIRLSLVSLPRPARILARDIEVDLDELAAATSTFAREILRNSCFDPAAPLLTSLAAASRALDRAAAAPGDPGPSPGRPFSVRRSPPQGSEVPSLGFDLRDEDGRLGGYEPGDGLHPLLAWGHVHLYGPDGEELESLQGPPWLILRDLSDVGLRLLEASSDPGETSFSFPLGHDAPRVEVDLAGETFTVGGRTLRCPPRALARALFAGALDFGGVLLARHPDLTQNPWLSSMIEEARQRLALCEQQDAARAVVPVDARAPRARRVASGPPLAPGEIRRVVLRHSWQIDLDPLRRLHTTGDHFWAIGMEGAVSVRWEDGKREVGIASSQIATAGRGDPLLSLDDAGRLLCHGPGGELAWTSPDFVGRRLSPSWFPLGHGLGAAVVENGALHLFERAKGLPALRFEPPAGSRSLAVGAGSLLALASNNGLLYGIDVSRREIGWRLPIGQAILALEAGGDGLIAVVDGPEGLVALGIDGRSGSLIGRTALPFHEIGTLVPLPSGWALAGVGGSGGEIALFDSTGALHGRIRPNLGRSLPSLVRLGSSLYVRGRSGLARIERGRVRWNVPCGEGGAPALARGLLALPGESLEVRVGDTGAEPHLAMPQGIPPVDFVLGDERFGFVVADSEGTCTRLHLAGALAVIG